MSVSTQPKKIETLIVQSFINCHCPQTHQDFQPSSEFIHTFSWQVSPKALSVLHLGHGLSSPSPPPYQVSTQDWHPKMYLQHLVKMIGGFIDSWQIWHRKVSTRCLLIAIGRARDLSTSKRESILFWMALTLSVKELSLVFPSSSEESECRFRD